MQMDKNKLSVFNAIGNVQARRELFENHPEKIPTTLDPKIEEHFTTK
jgi:hypothetical protein